MNRTDEKFHWFPMRRKFGRVKKKKGVREACFILNDFDSTKKGLPIFKESAKLDYQNTAVKRRSITVYEISPHSSFHHEMNERKSTLIATNIIIYYTLK